VEFIEPVLFSVRRVAEICGVLAAVCRLTTPHLPYAFSVVTYGLMPEKKEIYELTVIFRPGVLPAAAEKVVVDKLKTCKGKLVKVDVWGQRKLAYRIDKETEGLYLLFLVELPGDETAKLQNALKIDKNILRLMLIKQGR